VLVWTCGEVGYDDHLIRLSEGDSSARTHVGRLSRMRGKEHLLSASEGASMMKGSRYDRRDHREMGYGIVQEAASKSKMAL